ncbi:MAG: ATP-binding protein [Acidimicrobiales bacterium]
MLERRLRLLPRPESSRQARRFLREALVDAGEVAWRDDALLALTEVVTNAALHAHTDVEIRLAVRPGSLCAEVRDFNPTLPVERGYGPAATTGRGIGLIAALASQSGVHSLGAAGKVVWFCLGGEHAGPSASDLTAVWGPADDADAAPWRQVTLRSLPVGLWLSAREHHDAILRELGYCLAEEQGPDLPLVAADLARSWISSALTARLREAEGAGVAGRVPLVDQARRRRWATERLDLTLSVPADASWMFSGLQEVLDHAEALAAADKLLMAPALPEIVAVRDWACTQVVAQLDGAPPTPWSGVAHEGFETEVRETSAPAAAWDRTIVTASDRRVAAADDANRIIAVSRPLADLLGWSVERLVGRRVVTIIPPAYREAHVAAFSRHLTTGETHVLGVPLELPVLATSGDEIPCCVLIERVAGTGRPVYVATIDPLNG